MLPNFPGMTMCLLLAAGNSSRMQDSDAGRAIIPKMLLPYKGKTLLQHSIDEIKNFPESKLLVVTGCYHTSLKDILAQQQIEFVQNEQWKEGMGSSIRKGIIHVMQHYGNVDNVIILVCDQPYLSDGLLGQLTEAHQKTGKGIIASLYNGIMGTPVLFNKKYFGQLASLRGQGGAKKILQQFKDDVATIQFPLGEIDIDTMEDYEKLAKE